MDRRTYSSISSFKEWWGRVDYLVTNIIFVVKDFLFGKDGGIKGIVHRKDAEGAKKEALAVQG